MNGGAAAFFFALLVASASACEVALTAAETASDRARAVEFFGPAINSTFGYSATAAGDFNGDGFDDFAVSAPMEKNDAGAVYVIFGRSAEAWASATFDFSAANTPDPASWIRISGTAMSFLGFALACGDFNGDGRSDLIISTSNVGTAVVVYGHTGAWSSFSTAGIESGAVPGFKITGGGAGTSVGNAGDVNGDGIEDMLFSDCVIPDSTFFVVFGVPGANRAAFAFSSLDGTNGFSLTDGTNEYTLLGKMGSAGDVNGDGLDDLALGSYTAFSNTGRAYILFSRNVSATGQQWNTPISLASFIDGTTGFVVQGSSNSKLGYSVVGAGDVNADGFADVYIGSSAIGGSESGAWLVLGHAAPWTSPLSVAELNGNNGFRFATSSAELWGASGGGAAGDVNGDGFDDIVIGGKNAANSLGITIGAAVIVFGRSGSWPVELNRKDAVGSAGFLIDGPSAGSHFGDFAQIIGDVNGDDLADFVVGASQREESTGYAMLMFGVDDHCTVCSNTTDMCLVCDDGFFPNGATCTNVSVAASSSSSVQQGVSVVVIINFLENVTDPTELQEEIASVLGIDAGLVSVVVISPTEVEVTIIGGEETAQHLVDIINNGGAGSGSGSGLGLLRKAIDAHIRKDDNKDDERSSEDGIDAAPRVALCHLFMASLSTISTSLLAC